MIVGPNGAGKSNLLEAVYYLEVFRSFRGASDRELVRFGQDVFRVEATVEGPRGERSIAAACSAAERRKKVEVDGREPERLSDALGGLGAVVFSLDDLEIVLGLAVGAAALPRHPAVAGRARVRRTRCGKYRAVLAQRNEALKGGADGRSSRRGRPAWSRPGPR